MASIVDASGDLENAIVSRVVSAMLIAGQVDSASSCYYVYEVVYDNFIEGLVSQLKSQARVSLRRLHWGRSRHLLTVTKSSIKLKSANVWGPRLQLVDPSQIRVFGLWSLFEPIIISNVTTDMSCMQEEIFGPVLPVMKLGSLEEAIEHTNDSLYGLAASVWTENLGLAHWAADQLKARSYE